MTDLKELLGDVAEQAKVYDVSGPVMHTARRQHRMRLLAPLAAAAAVVVMAAAGWVLMPDTKKQEVAGSTPPGVVTNLDWLPAEARPPTTPPAVLPTDKAVGAGALVYPGCAGGSCDAHLLLSDGRQFRLGRTAPRPQETVTSVSLSPDGRWLGQVVGGAYVFRDLASTRTFRVERFVRVAGWSPDSRWVAVADPGVRSPMRGTRAAVVDLRHLRTVETTMPVMGASLLSTGELVYAQEPMDSNRLRVIAQDPRSTKTRVLMDVDLTDSLRAGEVALWPVSLTQDQARVLVHLSKALSRPGVTTIERGDIVEVGSRGAVARYELPPAVSGESWAFVGQYGKDLLLWHRDNATADLRALDTRTGKLRTVCRILTGTVVQVVMRGW